ncbi:PTS sugar transporter subunit IIA [Sporolactobacillus kofuensis]|uniref:PTS sugar transporter subunit IIA n=1 Tax=Sporolactobacillus kofuensis TaxID=269672 RepID=A0ABW1WF17_9BACL
MDQKRRFLKNKRASLATQTAARATQSTNTASQEVAPAVEQAGLLTKDNIFFEKGIETKDELFRFIAQKMKAKGIIIDQDQLIDAFQNREKQSSTGMEGGFAIPHAQSETIRQAAMLVVKLTDPITDWLTLDQKPVRFVIAFLIPPKGSSAHLHYLSETAQKLVDKDTVHQLITAERADQIYTLLK